MDPKAKAPNLDKWANEIRLMREQDGRTDAEIRAVFTWANQDGFWRSNILSPGKLREKFTTLDLKRKQGSNGNGRPDNDSTSPARVRGNGKYGDRHANV